MSKDKPAIRIEQHNTPLIITKDNIEVRLPPSDIKKVYRYFSNQQAGLNFLNGNIWFAAANRNRYYMGDPMEYYYRQHTRILTLSLSSSLTSYEEDSQLNAMPCCVEISDVTGFIQALRDDLQSETNYHKLSWLNKDELLKRAKVSGHTQQLLTIQKFQPDTSKCIEPVYMQITSLVGRKIEYYDDEIEVTPLSKEAVKRSSNIRKIHEGENEFRFEMNTSDILNKSMRNVGSALYPLIEYAKFSCPSITRHCKLLK